MGARRKLSILEGHFENEMNRIDAIVGIFNSHHLNVLSRCDISFWYEMLPIYEAMENPRFNMQYHRVEFYNGGKKTVIPKKLSDRIHTLISCYFHRQKIQFVKPLNQCQ